MGRLFPHDCSQAHLDDALSGRSGCNALNWRWKKWRPRGRGVNPRSSASLSGIIEAWHPAKRKYSQKCGGGKFEHLPFTMPALTIARRPRTGGQFGETPLSPPNRSRNPRRRRSCRDSIRHCRPLRRNKRSHNADRYHRLGHRMRGHNAAGCRSWAHRRRSHSAAGCHRRGRRKRNRSAAGCSSHRHRGSHSATRCNSRNRSMPGHNRGRCNNPRPAPRRKPHL